MKVPEKLTLENIWEKYKEDVRDGRMIYFNSMGIVAANEAGNYLFQNLVGSSTPYIIEDYRFGMVVNGSIRGFLNLKEYSVETGNIVFTTPGCILEPKEVSKDFKFMGFGIKADVFKDINPDKQPHILSGRVKMGIEPLDLHDQQYVVALYRILWNSLKRQKVNTEVVKNIASSIMWTFNDIFSMKAESPATTNGNAASKLFDRFIELVNMYSREQRALDFYADKLCVTKRYLGVAVSLASGVTAKEWIDKSVVAYAKALLSHSDMPIGQVADKLNFGNMSFFSKYFKRLAGCTPEEYRRKNFID